jgi:hypothetical protein
LHIAIGFATETPLPIDEDGGINIGIIMIQAFGENRGGRGRRRRENVVRKGRGRILRKKTNQVHRQIKDDRF